MVRVPRATPPPASLSALVPGGHGARTAGGALTASTRAALKLLLALVLAVLAYVAWTHGT